MSELKITQEKVTAAFSEANDCPKAISILTALFGKQKPDYTDYHNIKTYEDACEAIGVKPIVRLLVEDEDGHKEEAAKEARMTSAETLTTYGTHTSLDDFTYLSHDEIAESAFIKGADWQSKQSPWISVKGQLPDENEDIIILCKHGAIFNGTYSNNVWFCMDGYIYDTYKGNPIYSSMSSIPPSWEPIAWMPKPKFEE